MSGDTCPWRIRWGTTDETTTHCDRPAGHHYQTDHEGPGLRQFPHQRVSWQPTDRREYTGDWPGYCDKLPGAPFKGGCVLPKGHPRKCAP